MFWFNSTAVLCLALLATARADKEWFPGEQPARGPSLPQDDATDKDNFMDLEREWRQRAIAELLRERQLNRRQQQDGLDYGEMLQDSGEVQTGGQQEPSNVHDDGNDLFFAVDPSDPRFNDPSQQLQQPQQPEDSDLEVDSEADSVSLLPRIDPAPHAHFIGDDVTTLTYIAIVAACSLGGVVVVVVAGLLTHRLQKKAKAAADVEYPAYGITGPSKDVSPTTADRRLAQSAHMYHYQHQKQQIIAMERSSNSRRGSVSDPESEDDNEEGDYTVYECPGLASTGEMEVKNPLFLDDPTPATPAAAQTSSEVAQHDQQK